MPPKITKHRTDTPGRRTVIDALHARVPARNDLLLGLWYSQGLSVYAYVTGAGPALNEEQRGDLTGDPYFTDGLRAAMWLSGEPLNMEAVRYLDWETPPGR